MGRTLTRASTLAFSLIWTDRLDRKTGLGPLYPDRIINILFGKTNVYLEELGFASGISGIIYTCFAFSLK
jgi:hypothetical protein